MRVLNFIRGLFAPRLPSADPRKLDSVFVYDARAAFPEVRRGSPWSPLCTAVQEAAYCGEPGAVLALVSSSNSLVRYYVINLRKLPHYLLRERGLLHLVE